MKHAILSYQKAYPFFTPSNTYMCNTKRMHKIGSLSQQRIEKEALHLLNQRHADQRFNGGNGKSKGEVLPKLKPYVAIRALFTRIIPTDVTTLNNHDAASREAFRSPLLTVDMLN